MMRAELRSVDADVPIYQAGTVDDPVADPLGVPRAAVVFMAAVAAAAACVPARRATRTDPVKALHVG